MTRDTFDMDFVTGLRTSLEAAPPSTSKLSKADVLRELGPTLKDLRDNKGYTLEALVELLKQKGLNVKVSTIQGALKKKGSAKKKAAAAPPTSTSPQTTPLPPAASAGTVAASPAPVKVVSATLVVGATKKTA